YLERARRVLPQEFGIPSTQPILRPKLAAHNTDVRRGPFARIPPPVLPLQRGLLKAFDVIRQIRHEASATKFAVNEDIDPAAALRFKRLQDRFVLDFAK